MKVTKIVREYIEETVNAKYAPAIDAVKVKYSKEKENYEACFDAAKEEAVKTVISIFRKHMAPFYSAENMEIMTSHYDYCGMPSRYGAYPSWEEERDDAVGKLEKERAAAIKNILIELELGGTKADLDRLLSEINVPAMNEEV